MTRCRLDLLFVCERRSDGAAGRTGVDTCSVHGVATSGCIVYKHARTSLYLSTDPLTTNHLPRITTAG